MKNLIYACALFILLNACSKSPSEPEKTVDYKRATVRTSQSYTIYAAGEVAFVTIYISFPANSKANSSKITGIEVFSGNTQIYKIQNLDINSEYLTPEFTYEFKTSVLQEGINTFSYRLQYEDGYQLKGTTTVYAIKDKKIETWWENVSYDYLDTVSVFANMAKPIKDVSEVVGGMFIPYNLKLPTLKLIDGLYGYVYPIFDNSKKLQAIYVYHGTNLYDPGLSTTRIKDEILNAYPDCSVTASANEIYLLRNTGFSFRVYISGNNYFTEVKKNN